MHVAIVGAGALGRVYGVRLAVSGVTVTFVVRPARQAEQTPFKLVRIDGDRREDTLASPTRSATLPPSADCVVVCVRADQLDAPLHAELAGLPNVPVVMLTPMLPAEYAALERALGGKRLFAAMPGVVAYVNELDVTRYWVPRIAPTLVDEPRPPDPAVTALVDALVASGLPARLELGVHETNPATTVAFIPLFMGIDAAGGIDALLGDDALLGMTLDAGKDGLALSRRLGKAAPWAGLLTRFAGRRTLRIGLAIARRRSKEAVAYVEEHFGHKLHTQNVAMAGAMVRLATEKGTPNVALRALLERLKEPDHAETAAPRPR